MRVRARKIEALGEWNCVHGDEPRYSRIGVNLQMLLLPPRPPGQEEDEMRKPNTVWLLQWSWKHEEQVWRFVDIAPFIKRKDAELLRTSYAHSRHDIRYRLVAYTPRRPAKRKRRVTK